MRHTLLIAEGDAELCDVYRRFLAARGFTVETATNGLDCLEKLRRVKPTALVLDHNLHWGGGDGVLAWLREQDAPPDVPVVLTANAAYQPQDADATRPPVVKFLPKPFPLTALLESVGAAISNWGIEKPPARKNSTCTEMFYG
jgi:DNA-binding NtrC family response regulator